jgi:hypothetical protein
MSGIATAPAIHVSITHMPARGHSMAPCFDGNALNLHLYFDEVESLSIDAGLNVLEQGLQYITVLSSNSRVSLTRV